MHDRIDAFCHAARHEGLNEETIGRQVESMYRERERLLDLAAYPWEETVADKALRTAKAQLDQPREGLGEMVREYTCEEMLMVLAYTLDRDIRVGGRTGDLGACSSLPHLTGQVESASGDQGPHTSHAPFAGGADSAPASLNDILKHVKAHHDIRLYIKNGRLFIDG
jgi:hypothetical protein